MKHLSKLSLLLASVLMLSLTSCLREAADPNSGEGYLPSNVATLDEQVASMKTSINAMESLQTTLSEITSLENITSQFEGSVVAVKEHIASIEAGLSDVNATLATMRLQKEIANVTGVLKIQVASLENPQTIQAALLSLENGVSTWLGKDFNNFVGVSSELAGLSVLTESVESQSLTTDALTSDVEAGLRVGDATEELAAMVKTVGSNAQTLAKLTSEFDALSTEVEDAYTNAIKSTGSDTGDALKNVNTKAAAALKSSAVTLADLASRVSNCETEIADIQGRLTQIEASVAELLSKIQSLTFMSQYSEEYVIAYYNMDNNSKVTAPGKPYDGKSVRTPVETIELNYMIRPASAAAAVTKDVVSVVGYYADQIQTKSIDPTRFVNFAVSGVSVTNAERGIVTVTMSHDLKDDFYYRQTGAKCALFVATGKTDVASKFVELYPKDRSTNVYVESIKIDQDDFEIDEGQTKNLTATVNPSSATNKTIKWTSLNTEIATIDQYSGVLTAVKQGNVTITATTNDINEWGDNLTASVNVKVNPAIRLGGPLYVEVGKTAELSLDFPPAMNIESKVWMSSDETKATVNEDGVVTGVEHNYNEFTFVYEPKVVISCIINGNITLTHEMEVIVPQPTGIRFNDYADDVTSLAIKLYQQISLAGTLIPSESNADYFTAEYFTIKYSASKDGSAVSGFVDFYSGSIAPGSTGTWTVTATVDDDNDKDNRLKKSVKRSMVINVAPYYVKTMTLPATHDMLLDQTATLPVTFTSDVEGMAPTYTNLRWTSSDPTVVSINETTGEMTALKEGSATVTATTTHADAVPSGQTQKSASCIVTVKKPTAPIAIGDYYYSDGTWSTEKDNSKTVVGIVFSKVGATTTDSKLNTDHPHCYNGLVVSLEERTTAWQSSAQNVSSWVTTNLSYGDLRNYGKTNGYSNTIALKAYNEQNSANKVLAVDGTAPSAGAPGLSSGWYLPSYKELSLLAESYATIKDKLASVGTALDATTPNFNIGSGGSADTYRYWASTESASSSSWGCCVQFSNCSMMDNQGKNKNYYRVRYILAF